MEILIAIGIITIALISLLGVTAFSLQISTLTKETAQAEILARGAVEAIRSFREATDWGVNGLGVLNTGENNPYKPQLDNGVNPPKWDLVLGQETINNFTRKIVFQRVSRDPATGNIESVYNPANDDSDTRKAAASTSWKNKKIEIITYFTNWKQ